MAVVMTLTSLPIGLAHAGMITTKTIIDQQTPAAGASDQAEAQRERIRDLLARDDVRAEMIALGIAPAEAEARIAALTDQEIADIAGRLDELPAGEGVGTILIAIFIVFGVAVLLDALGMMNVFPFVCGPDECGRQVQAYYPEPAAGPAEFDNYGYDERRSAYRRDRFDSRDRGFGERTSRRGQQRFDSSEYYNTDPYNQSQTQSRTRNYFEERSGAQRYVR